MSRSIEVIVSASGELKIDAVGFKGADCEQATKFLEVALGIVGQKTRKPEYHLRTVTKAKQRIGQ